MKERTNLLLFSTIFLLPLLVILASPSFSSMALGLDRESARPAAVSTAYFYSSGLYDGWVLESGEFTGVGGSMNFSSTEIALGDDKLNRQYRGILSFNTKTLGSHTGTIVGAALYVTGNGVVGLNPFTWGKNSLRADIIPGAYGGNATLQVSDFQAPGGLANAGIRTGCAVTGKCGISLSAASLPYLNSKGLTQFRLRFMLDDNNNHAADYYRIFSGNSVLQNRPVLAVQFYP